MPLLFFTMLGACASPDVSSSPTDEHGRVESDKAFLRLHEILPIPEFPAATISAEVKTAEVEPDRRAQRYLQRGRERFEEQLWAEALSAFEKALQFDVDLIEARIMLARASLQHGNYGLAESHLHEVLNRRPRDAAAHQLLGEIAWQRNMPTEAIRSLRLAIRAGAKTPHDPPVVLARLTLAMALQKEGYLTAAAAQVEAYVNAVKDSTPKMQEYHELKEVMVLYRVKAPTLLGEIYTTLESFGDAVDAYRRAVEAAPDDAGLRREFALAQARSGQIDEALQTARQWLATVSGDESLHILEEICLLSGHPERYDLELVRLANETSDATARVNIAKLLVERGNQDEAVRLLERTLDSSEIGAEARYMLARLHAQNRRLDASCRLVIETLREFPDSDAAARSLLASEGAEEHGGELLSEARKLAVDRANDGAVRFVLGALLQAQGSEKEAIAEFEAAVRLDASFGAAYAAMARSYRRSKQWEQVISSVDRAIAAGIRKAALFVDKGIAHDALSETEAAENALFEAFRLDRRSAEPLYQLALSAERRGEQRRCEQLYRRILDDVDPHFHPARERLVRLYAVSGKHEPARAYASDFARLGEEGAAAERCRAMLDLATTKPNSGEDRLQKYRAALERIIERYPDDAATYLDLANTFVAEKNFAKAMTHADKALLLDPDNLAGRELQATLHARLLQFDRAIEVMERLLADRPRDVEYLKQMLRFADSENDYDGLVTLLNELLARDDLADRDSLFTGPLILALVVAGRLDAAVERAGDWQAEAPGDLLRRQVYRTVLSGAKRHQEAVTLAEKFLAEDPTNLSLRVQLLAALQSSERYLEAQQRALAWLAEEPDNFTLNNALLRLCTSADQWDDAIEIARTGMRLSDRGAPYERLLGHMYRSARRFDAAISHFRERAQQDATPIAQLDLIETLIQANQFAEAERVVNKTLRPQIDLRNAGRPFDRRWVIGLRSLLADIYQNTNRQFQAIQQLEENYALDPNDPLINNNLGYSWADEGMNLDRGEAMIRYALSHDPRSDANLDSLGWVLYKKGNLSEAIAFLRRAVKAARRDRPIIFNDSSQLLPYLERAFALADRADPVILDHLGDALFRAGHATEARGQWEKAKSLSAPDHDPPPDREELALHEVVTWKLEQLDAGEVVDTAEIVTATPPAPSSGETVEECGASRGSKGKPHGGS